MLLALLGQATISVVKRHGRKLRGISGQEAVKAFKRLGYSERKGKGSHIHLVKPGSPRLTIPLHDELSVGLLQHEIKRAGLTVEEFLRLLEG